MIRRPSSSLRLGPRPTGQTASNSAGRTSPLTVEPHARRAASQLQQASSSSKSFNAIHSAWFRSPSRPQPGAGSSKTQDPLLNSAWTAKVAEPDPSAKRTSLRTAANPSTRTAPRRPYSVQQWEGGASSDVDFSFLASAGPSVLQPSAGDSLSICDVWFARPVRPSDGEVGPRDKSRRSPTWLVDDGARSKRGFKSKTLTLVPSGGNSTDGVHWGLLGDVDGGERPREAFSSLSSVRKRVVIRAKPTPEEPPPIIEGSRPLPPHFFTANAEASSSRRQSRIPAPPRVHDFHNAPFDPSAPTGNAPSAFGVAAPPSSGKFLLGRRSRASVQPESLQPAAPAPPSTFFQSPSRPLYFNPAARRTASEIIDPNASSKKAKRSVAAKAKPKADVPANVEPAPITLVEGTPDETWAQYAELTPAGFSSSLLAALFDSQSKHADLVVRRERLVNVALRASAFDSAGETQLGVDRLQIAFEAGLETAEAHEPVEGDSQRERAIKLGHREDLAVALREIWRPITDLTDQGDDGLTWAGSNELLWRWVGLLAWDGPESPGEELVARSYSRPGKRADRVDDLALFLDKMGAPAESQLEDFALSISRGWVNQDLVKELQEAKQQVVDVRLHRNKVLSTRRDGSFTAKETREKLWSFLRDAYGGRKGVAPTAVEGWVETLLVAPKLAAAVADETTPVSVAVSLSSRWTSAMLLVRNLAHSQREPPASCLWHLCDALQRLKTSDDHQVPLQNLRALTSIILQTHPGLTLLAPRQHYDLLLEFIAHEDLAFAERLYQAFRIRERSFAFPESVTMPLLKLAVGLRQASPADGENVRATNPAFAGAVYDDRMAWGAKAISGKVLFSLIYAVGREPKLGGLATRILSDSIVSHGPGVITDEVAMSISQSAHDRVVQAVLRAANPSVRPTAKDQMVTASSAFCVLPLIRGCYRGLSRPPPVSAFNRLLALAALHPTPYNTQAAVAEFTTMMNHGPLPDLETFNILIRMHLGVRTKRDGIAAMFDKLEPCEPRINLVRAITLFKTMVVRQGIQPDEQTFSSFLQGLLSVGQPAAAFECFRHAVHLKLIPSHASTLMLVRALVDEGQHAQANNVVDALTRLKDEQRSEDSISAVAMEASEMKALSDTVLSTVIPTATSPPPAQFGGVAPPEQPTDSSEAKPEASSGRSAAFA